MEGKKGGMKGERWRERKKGIREGKKNCTQRKVFGLPNWTYTLDHMGLKMQLASSASSASESITCGMTLFQDTPVFLFPASQGLNADGCKTQGFLVHFMHHCSLGFWFIKPEFCGAQKVSCDLRTVFSNRGWCDWSVLYNDPQTLRFWTANVYVLFMLLACCKNTVASTGPHSGTLAARKWGPEEFYTVPYRFTSACNTGHSHLISQASLRVNWVKGGKESWFRRNNNWNIEGSEAASHHILDMEEHAIF